MIAKSSYIFIITGKTGSGKTSFTAELIKRLLKREIKISGFLAPATSLNTVDKAYNIQNIQTYETSPLASVKHLPGWIKTGRFYFNPQAISFGNKILLDHQPSRNNLVVIDEIGPLELHHKIWYNSVNQLLSIPNCNMIWVVRSSLTEKVIKKWILKKPVVIDIEKSTVGQAEQRIISNLNS